MKFLRSLLPWLCFGLPFLLILWLQRAYAFRNLSWDDWALVQDRFPGKDLTPNWGDLFAPYSGHSIPWLRLSVIPAIRMAGGDARFLLVLCVLLALGSALMLRKLAVASLGRATWVTSLIIGLTVASPVLAQVWQWWICWPIFLPFFCLLLGVTILRGAEFGWGRFSVVLGLAWIASQAQAAGAMVWLALVPSLRAFWQATPRRTGITAAVVLLAVGAYILKPFFLDSVSNGDNASMLDRLPKIAAYGMALLGGPIAQGWTADSIVPCQIAGALLGLGMLWIVLLVVRRLPLNGDLAGWCSVASFGFFSAVAIAFGRYWLPVYQALVGRYLLLSYPLWLGLYFALRTWNNQRNISASGNPQPMSRAWIAATAAIILGQLNAWSMGYREMKLCHAQHLSGGAALNFIKLFPEHQALRTAFPDLDTLREMVLKLDQGHGLYGFTLYPDASIEKLGRQEFLRPNKGGRVSRVTADAEGRIHMDGFAYLDEVDRPADLILLTWETEAQPKPQIIELIPMIVRQDYYRSGERFRRPEYFNDWHAEVDPAQLPSSSGKLRAWAFNHDTKQVYLLRNAAVIADGKLTRMDAEVPPLDRAKKVKK